MKIVSLTYGKFPAVSQLHRNFQPGVKRLRITLDLVDSLEYKNNFSNIYSQLLILMPTLAKHKCCENWSGRQGNSQVAPRLTSGIPIKKMGDMSDYAHLIEHVIIDLQCHIGDMKICSGITCGYQFPKYRFDLFVECNDKKIGVFAANLAVYLVAYLRENQSLPPNSLYLIDLARYLAETRYTRLSSGSISQKLGWKEEIVSWALEKLRELHFFNNTNTKLSKVKARQILPR